MLPLVLAAALSGLELGAIAASSADLATTHAALSHGGFQEANPVLYSRPALTVAKVAGTAAVVGISRHLRKRGKHKAAKVLCLVAIGVWTSAAAWNTYQMGHR